MSFDGIMLRHVVTDLNNHLLNTRITKIYQLSSYDLLFQARGHKNHTFLMSTSPKYTRIHRTENKYEKPDHPPMFCMFLRKHLEGNIITNIAQHGNDRVVTFTLKGTNEMGDMSEKHLIFEALGKDANIIVTDNAFKILETLKHSGPFDETERTIYPSALYEYPKDERVNPYDLEALESLFSRYKFEAQKDYLDRISGISPLFIKELLFRVKTNQTPPFSLMQSMLSEQDYHILEGKKTLYYCLTIIHTEGVKHRYESIPELFDHYFFERDQADKRKQKAKDLEGFINRQIEKLKNKIEKLNKDLLNKDALEDFKKKGELILSFQHLIKKGDRTLECIDYYTDKPITIALDVKKTPIQNSEHYFKKYKKTKNSIPHIHEQIRKTDDDLDYFLLLKEQLNHASLADIDEMREELTLEGYLKSKSKPQKKKVQKAQFSLYLDPLGNEILVGKNNLQNSYITHKEAVHFHVWFHVQNSPGSHVVVKNGFPLDEVTIRTCAQLASYFSPNKEGSSVAVDYTEIKHIKKIPGKRTCFVRYTNQKTIYIDPDEAFIKSLKKIK
ncbi:Rqc2 family fibronectin-binding protein [Liberiplasma polymorphum]|uniref:Rqc2 family fibronectin-binding protein n=1 Tax=Liberiplasma polymorphum TaxID=3374570 RepID=UPI0037719673